MLLNPQQLVDNQTVKGTVSVQPNAIDFTIDSINVIEPTIAYIANDKTLVQHASQHPISLVDVLSIQPTFGNLHPEREIEPGQVFGWLLQPNHEYDVTSNVYVEVPEGTAAFLVVRSTLNRNGVSLSSGLYDSGFKGNIGFVLRTGNAPVFIEQGTFGGQIYFTESQNAGKYAGGYNTKDGQHWKDAVSAKAAEAPKAETKSATKKVEK